MPFTALDLLARTHWPELTRKLGERLPAFLSRAAEHAQAHGLHTASTADRYVNLCFALGPGFENKPENEWALAVLVDERLQPEAKAHQLVLRAAQELQRRGADAAALRAADAAVLDAQDAARRATRGDDSPPLPRAACDLEALDLRLEDVATWRRVYQVAAHQWTRQPPQALPAPLRIDARHPAPRVLSVLTHARGQGPAATLLLRQAVHGQCSTGEHPCVRWVGEHGVTAWQGSGARQVSLPVVAAPWGGAGEAIAEETPPDVSTVLVPTCGLRDEGVPLGPQQLQLWAYPAHQWCWSLQRDAAWERQWPLAPGAASATALPSGATSAHPTAANPSSAKPGAAAPGHRWRIERDGAARSHAKADAAFAHELPQVLAAGLQPLFEAWNAATRQATLRARIQLFDGQAGLSWGWHEGPQGLADDPVMRVIADMALRHAVDLQFDGEIEHAGARARLTLGSRGGAALDTVLRREAPTPPLADLLPLLQVRWRQGFEAQADPIASEDGVVISSVGSCTGAVVGEAGLRPRPAGSGWQWFVRLSLEPVSTVVRVHDPVLGHSETHLALLGSQVLAEWCHG